MPQAHISSRKPWTSGFARRHPTTYLGLHATVGLLLSLLCAWAFYAIAAALIARRPMVWVDHFIARWVNAHNTESGESVVHAFSYLGEQALWGILGVVALALLWRRKWAEAVLVAVGAGGGAVLNALLKVRFHRQRPIFAHEFAVDGASFPSGHSMGSVIGYGILAFLLLRRVTNPRARGLVVLAAVGLVLALGGSRIYLDVHYLSDVVAGFAAGGLWLSVCLTGFSFATEWTGWS